MSPHHVRTCGYKGQYPTSGGRPRHLKLLFGQRDKIRTIKECKIYCGLLIIDIPCRINRTKAMKDMCTMNRNKQTMCDHGLQLCKDMFHRNLVMNSGSMHKLSFFIYKASNIRSVGSQIVQPYQ